MFGYDMYQQVGADEILNVGAIEAFEGDVSADLGSRLLCIAQQTLNLFNVSNKQVTVVRLYGAKKIKLQHTGIRGSMLLTAMAAFACRSLM